MKTRVLQIILILALTTFAFADTFDYTYTGAGDGILATGDVVRQYNIAGRVAYYVGYHQPFRRAGLHKLRRFEWPARRTGAYSFHLHRNRFK